jgi:hypothetical protein
MRFRHIFCAAIAVQFGLLAALPGQAAEQLSAREKAWFDTFQKGTLYARGWRDISSELVAKAPAEIKSDLQQRLETLGLKIGREWSKSNDIRKIDSSMLRQWGDMLQQAAERQPEHIPQVVAKLDQKVVALLD